VCLVALCQLPAACANPSASGPCGEDIRSIHERKDEMSQSKSSDTVYDYQNLANKVLRLLGDVVLQRTQESVVRNAKVGRQSASDHNGSAAPDSVRQACMRIRRNVFPIITTDPGILTFEGPRLSRSHSERLSCYPSPETQNRKHVA